MLETVHALLRFANKALPVIVLVELVASAHFLAMIETRWLSLSDANSLPVIF